MDCEAGKESELQSKIWEIIKANIESNGQRRQLLEAGANRRVRNRAKGTSDKKAPRISIKIRKEVAKIPISFERHLVKHLGKLGLSAISSRKILSILGSLNTVYTQCKITVFI